MLARAARSVLQAWETFWIDIRRACSIWMRATLASSVNCRISDTTWPPANSGWENTTLEVLSAQQVLEEAQLSLVNARHDEYVASATVLNVMGLLEARNLVPGIDSDLGVHSFDQLKHAPGYVPGVDEAVSSIDSIGHKGVRTLPPELDKPIATGAQPAAK